MIVIVNGYTIINIPLYHYTIIPWYHYTIVIVILLPRHNCSSHRSRTEALPKNRGNYNVAPQL